MPRGFGAPRRTTLAVARGAWSARGRAPKGFASLEDALGYLSEFVPLRHDGVCNAKGDLAKRKVLQDSHDVKVDSSERNRGPRRYLSLVVSSSQKNASRARKNGQRDRPWPDGQNPAKP